LTNSIHVTVFHKGLLQHKPFRLDKLYLQSMVMLLTLKCLHLVVAKLIFMSYIAVTYDQCLADPTNILS